jgi:hypothetical protein
MEKSKKSSNTVCFIYCLIHNLERRRMPLKTDNYQEGSFTYEKTEAEAASSGH